MCVTMHKGDPAAAQIPAEVNPTRFHHPKKMSLVLDACGIVSTLSGCVTSGDCSGQTVPLPKWEAFEHTAVLEF